MSTLHNTTTARLMQRIQTAKANAQRLSDLRQLKQMTGNSHPEHLSPAAFDFMCEVLSKYPDDLEVFRAIDAAAQAQTDALMAELEGY